MGQTLSPLRYPGGKSRLSNFFKIIIKNNNLINGTYIEPYAGGAGIAWKLLSDNFIHDIILNDINHSIFAFWHSVFNQTDSLCNLIRNTEVTINEWYKQKNIQLERRSNNLELGFSTFFLNRTNRSGIISAGVIGGKKQDGLYKLNARYNKDALISKIERIASFKDKVKIYNQDALLFLKRLPSNLAKNSLIYLDPPYYRKGSALYEDHYSHDDHVSVAFELQNSNTKWIVSYDNTPEICEIYSGFKNIVYDLSYSAAKHYKGKEIIFFSEDLLIPLGNPLLAKF